MLIRTGSTMLWLLLGLAVVGSAQAASCPQGVSTDGPGRQLQDIFNSVLPSGSVNAASGCLADGTDAAWVTQGQASATILLEIAGYASQNQMGIYDIGDTSKRLMVFDGPASQGSYATINLIPSGGAYMVVVNQFNADHTLAATRSETFGSSVFGFFLTPPSPSGTTYFSDTTKNADGQDHLLAYSGNGQPFQNSSFGNLAYLGSFRPLDHILGWEDLAGGGDNDYNDMLVLVRDVTPVPLPGAAWLFMSGFAGLGALRRRRGSSVSA